MTRNISSFKHFHYTEKYKRGGGSQGKTFILLEIFLPTENLIERVSQELVEGYNPEVQSLNELCKSYKRLEFHNLFRLHYYAIL